MSARCGFSVLALATLLLGAPASAQRAEDPGKFMASIEQQGAALESMSAAEQLYQSCIYCHGENGNAGSSFYPRLAGQPSAYLKQQLNAYRTSSRENTIMSSMARILSEQEIDVLANYLSAQTPLQQVTATVPARQLTQGREKAKQLACAGCHGSNYQGQGEYPRLAGQGYTYLVIQLKSFRDGQRQDPQGIMAGLVKTLSDSDIENLSAYFSEI